MGSLALAAAARVILPLARGPLPLATAMLLAWACLSGLAVPISAISVASLRQAITPDSLQGRVNATLQFLNTIPVPLGSLFGGYLGNLFGTRAVLAVTASGFVLVVVGCFLSPLRTLRELPSPIERAATEGNPA